MRNFFLLSFVLLINMHCTSQTTIKLDTGWGMSVYNPLCTKFLAGMSGVPGKEAADGSTSYIAPVKKEILYKNSVYEYRYYILIGNLEEMREKIYSLKDGSN